MIVRPTFDTDPMTVDKMGFLLQRLGQDCPPLQFLRELTHNSVQAIERAGGTGDILWDLDQATALEGRRKLAVIDTGIGMSGEEMLQYLNRLSSSGYEQHDEGNYGFGAKIAALTRNRQGLMYLSWRAPGEGAMLQLWQNPLTGDFGAKRVDLGAGSYASWAPIDDDLMPDAIRTAGHGTVVVLLGNEANQDTTVAPPEAVIPSRWISRYLNGRYFRLPEGVTLRARDWDSSADLGTVTGQGPWLEKQALASGQVELSGAIARWWIVRPGGAHASSSYVSTGHVAARYQDELYEMTPPGRPSTQRLQSFGVIFGHTQVVIYVEPRVGEGRRLGTNSVRSALLLNGEPLPWTEWAAEFRERLPDDIAALMEERSSAASMENETDTIRRRLRAIRDLLRLSRYRPSRDGSVNVDDERRAGGLRRPHEEPVPDGEPRNETVAPAPSQERAPREPRPPSGNAGDVFSLFLKKDGQPAERSRRTEDIPTVKWISKAENTREDADLEDRAARYLPEQHILILNGDFRGFTDLIDHWTAQYDEVPGARSVIVRTARAWFAQGLAETVMSAQSLRGSRFWTDTDLHLVLSEEALTAAAMQRYHVDFALRRELGTLLGSLRKEVAPA